MTSTRSRRDRESADADRTLVPLQAAVLVDAREAARRLQISTRKLWDLTSRGEIECVRLGRSVRYSVEHLEQWAVGRSCRSGRLAKLNVSEGTLATPDKGGGERA